MSLIESKHEEEFQYEKEPLIPLHSDRMTDFQKNLFLTKQVKDLKIEIGMLNSQLDEYKYIESEKNLAIIEKEKTIKRNRELLSEINNLKLKLEKQTNKNNPPKQNRLVGKTIRFWRESKLITSVIVGVRNNHYLVKTENDNDKPERVSLTNTLEIL